MKRLDLMLAALATSLFAGAAFAAAPAVDRTESFIATFKKVDAVFKSGNATRDDIPSHLIVGEDISAENMSREEAGIHFQRSIKRIPCFRPATCQTQVLAQPV